jgi:hypothetical protein
MEKLMEKKPEESKKVKPDTVADKIWNEIADKNIDMFALPNQTVKQYCKPVTVEPSKLYLLLNASSVLPSLEVALGSKFVVKMVDKYATVEYSNKK